MNTKRHLIALDLDGTLLTDNKTITDRTKYVINKIKSAGHIVVIATGRPDRASLTYYNELNLDTPMVNFNGAYLHHPTDKKWEALHTPLPLPTAQAVIRTCYQLGVNNMMAEVLGNVYIDRYDEEFMKIFHIKKEENQIQIGQLNRQLTLDPTSLIIHPSQDQVERLRQNLEQNHAEVIEHRHWGAPWNMIEVVRKGMNKGVAVSRIAQHYNIAQEQIIAFGDEDNDFEMIKSAGIGVAMKNGANHLKEIANYQTTTNEEDGVAVFLEKYFDLS
ncbi:Cof-type HAD-IIB family hydrolase [Amphibacillus xylanus]|uniref:Putative phosphatase n=1 Tax=Amphibacillus xylanus (strain ATCC 51415 / DSM 6626 / JCM 7361 / LMG 17667 / NBRC 15112 / Ep01) TaxID=698758 RepID=K0J7T8_AMPXN|nr:Cof-type HAD-IIB family hydrolase [Amphibacillus xylanus]BAM47943.1 putative phosphatase [Amphibacillus xylanus NBRC 15112]